MWLFYLLLDLTISFLYKRHSVGDTNIPLCLQSCVKPLKYAIAVTDLGTDYVHQHVDKEPSGHRFNKLQLNQEGERFRLSIPERSISESRWNCLWIYFMTYYIWNYFCKKKA